MVHRHLGGLAPVLLLAGLAAPVVAANRDEQSRTLLQSASTYRFMVGDVRVTALSDGTVPIDLHALLRGTTPARTDAVLRRSFLTNPVEASINVYLLEIGKRRVLVDTGAGELFGPGNGGKFVANLAAVGVTPDQIDDILITHVHSDHSGGLVRDRRIIFPNALIHVGKPDVDFFLDPANGSRTGYADRYFEEAAKTLKPYVDTKRVRTFSSNGTIMPGVSVELRPGHTPGSAFYTLKSRGERLIFVGDIIHVGEIQLPSPSITITFDVDQPAAAKVRRRSLAEFARARTLIAAPHLPFPGVGNIRQSATGYEYVAVAFGDRKPLIGSAALAR